MSEELLQRDLLNNPPRFGRWFYYNIGATSLSSLKKHGIIPFLDYEALERRKPDGLIAAAGQVIAVIENKVPSQLDTEEKVSSHVKKWLPVARKLNARILILTDTKRSFWINTQSGSAIVNAEGQHISEPFSTTSDQSAELFEHVFDTLDDQSGKLTSPVLKDPTPLARQIWQDIWSVSGATPENCLYTFVELFIFKYLSDLKVLTGQYSFSDLLSKYSANTEEDVLEYYANIVRPRVKQLFPASAIDGTTIINGTIFVSKDGHAVSGYSTVFRKILVRFQREGTLADIHHDFKSKLFESFLKESISKKNWGQFFTPLKVVRSIVAMCNVREGMSICDPACGVGKFLLEPILSKIDRFYDVNGKVVSPKISLFGFDKGFDKEEQKTIILAKANMLIYLSDVIRKWPSMSSEFATLFNSTFRLETGSILGTLANPEYSKYDLILTNPPYVTSGSSNLKEEVKKCGLESHYSVSALGVEGLFMQWIVNALKPGGEAFVIVPDGILSRIPDKQLRQFILRECFLDAVISLPNKTFFTTTKKTSILKLTKKFNRSDCQKHPVLTYIVSDIGESLDTYRFDTGHNQLEDEAKLYNQFKGSKDSIITQDKRCKIVPISHFCEADANSWLVHQLWSESERIELGLAKEDFIVDPSGFESMLDDVVDAIGSYKIPLKEVTEASARTEFVEVSVFDDRWFELTRGKRITRKTVIENPGDVPVYSSSKSDESVLGYVSDVFLKKNNLVLFTEPSVLLNIDGSVGHSFVRRAEKYSFIDVVAALKPKSKEIDLDYLNIALQERLKQIGATYETKLYFGKMKSQNLTIKIPVKADGHFDLQAQKTLASQYLKVQEIKADLASKLQALTEVDVSFS